MCQVSTQNFWQLLPKIREQIEHSCFLAIDTEFSSLETLFSAERSSETIEQFYEQRLNLARQMTIFQFGLAIFSLNNDENKRYHVDIYNFYLHPPSIPSIDVKYVIQSSSIKFLLQSKFDFTRCFSHGISFLNLSEENRLRNSIKSGESIRYSLNEKNFLNDLFKEIHQWFISAELNSTMKFDLNDEIDLINDYFIELEIRRCFNAVRTKIEVENEKKFLLIERVETNDDDDDDEQFDVFIQSIVGFSTLIRYIRDNYRQPIVGHNCFLDWLLIYEKFLDDLPENFDRFQSSINRSFSMSFFDTKYLAFEMRDYLFSRQNKDNFTTLTSLSSLYDLLNSSFYDRLIFFKPSIDIDRYEKTRRTHEAGYDALMSGVVFLKLIYLYRQKKSSMDYEDFFVTNEIQTFRNRFYSTFLPFISLNRTDRTKMISIRRSARCLVLRQHNGKKLNLTDIQMRLNAYGSIDYELSSSSNEIYLYIPSEQNYRRILADYKNHSSYEIDEYHWWKDLIWSNYVRSVSIVLLAFGLICLLKDRK